MEKIQERALRFITGDHNSSCETLLNTTEMANMRVRMQNLCIEIYKTLANMNPPCMQELFERSSSSYSARRPYDLMVPSVNQTSFGSRSIKFEGARLWIIFHKILSLLITCLLLNNSLKIGRDLLVDAAIVCLLKEQNSKFLRLRYLISEVCFSCTRSASGAPWLHPNLFTKVHFAGYEPKDTKIKLMFMSSFYIACYQPVCLAVVSGKQTGVAGGDSGVSAFPVGVAVLLLFLQLSPCIL